MRWPVILGVENFVKTESGIRTVTGIAGPEVVSHPDQQQRASQSFMMVLPVVQRPLNSEIKVLWSDLVKGREIIKKKEVPETMNMSDHPWQEAIDPHGCSCLTSNAPLPFEQ